MKFKKSQFWPATFTAKLIYALIFTVAGIFIVREISEAAVTGYDKALCKSTVLANSRLRNPYTQVQHIKVSCPTRFVTVGLDEIIIESGGDKQKIEIKCKEGIFKKGTKDTEKSKKCFLNKTNSVMANLIFDCWDQFGAGQLRIFSNYPSEAKYRQCMICSRTEFKQEVKDLFAGETVAEENTLQEYMIKHNPKFHQITYYQFSLDQTDAFNPPQYYYTFDEPWSVVFVAQNKHAIKDGLIKPTWEAFEAWWTETQPKEKEMFVNTLKFVEYDGVVDECDVLV
ncbi:hypothetical protein KY331_01990 [Candidatus Woesearchaeota archaeon]|nr:hypothetical protein [Candidatus Woesearchaeota archaeon]